VVVIDEYAELVTIYPRPSARIRAPNSPASAEARAVGIHMIIATQRPTTEFVTGAVKANLSTRISFRLPARGQHDIIDQPGAENCWCGRHVVCSKRPAAALAGYFVSMDEIATLVTELAQPKERT